jgi:hypothetical protein
MVQHLASLQHHSRRVRQHITCVEAKRAPKDRCRRLSICTPRPSICPLRRVACGRPETEDRGASPALGDWSGVAETGNYLCANTGIVEPHLDGPCCYFLMPKPLLEGDRSWTSTARALAGVPPRPPVGVAMLQQLCQQQERRAPAVAQ